MHPDRAFAPDAPTMPGADDLVSDLQLDDLLETMAFGDPRRYGVARTALTAPLVVPDEIRHRQRVLADCLGRPQAIERLHDLCSRALAVRRPFYPASAPPRPGSILSQAVSTLTELTPLLHELVELARSELPFAASEGLHDLYAGVVDDLDDEFFAASRAHLRRLRFRHGVVVGKRLGPRNQGVGDVLRPPDRAPVLERIGVPTRQAFSFQVDPRDSAGTDELASLVGRAVNRVADATAQAVDLMLGFFGALRDESGFYLGCIRLHEVLTSRALPVCIPVLFPEGAPLIDAHGVYDPHLALGGDDAVVPNDIPSDAQTTIVITGANSGGKSTLLRAIGCAQLMTQAGMFAPARSWSARIATSISSHFVREEDADMVRGRFADELQRLSDIVDRIRPGAWLLMNETFAGTDDAEAAEIGADVVRGFARRRVATVLVTHNFDLASRITAEPDVLSLRAERRGSGERSFRLVPAPPLPTAFGHDLYLRMGGWVET